MMGRPPKYRTLQQYLAAQAGDSLTLTFGEIERLIRAPLPFGAWSADWWRKSPRHSPQAQAWGAAGWRVQAVSTSQQTVTFVRQGQPEMP